VAQRQRQDARRAARQRGPGLLFPFRRPGCPQAQEPRPCRRAIARHPGCPGWN